MTTRPILTVAALAFLASSAAALKATAQQSDSIPGLYPSFKRAPRPKAPLIIDGVCPFECCQYGKWTLRRPAALLRRPRASAPLLARLRKGYTVIADSGFMLIDTIGVVAVQRDVVDGMYGTQFHRGDTLLVLDFMGEGQYNAWWRGYAITVESFWDSPPERPDSAKVGKIVRHQTSTWWARVRDARSRRGWLDMGSADVAGADSCA